MACYVPGFIFAKVTGKMKTAPFYKPQCSDVVLLLVLFAEGSKSRTCDYAENVKQAAASKPPLQKLNLDPAGQVHLQPFTVHLHVNK